jgi:hypothetical protein
MAKKRAKEKFYYVLENGNRYEITGRNGKYIICGDTQFRRSANRGVFATEAVPEETAKEVTKEAEE